MELKSLALDRRVVIGLPLLAAIAVRLELWREYVASPLDQYAKITTLDMATLMGQARSFIAGDAPLTMHRLLCAASSFFTGGGLSVHGVVAAQMALGVLVAPLCALATLRLSGSRVAALVAGLFAGCYAPALMYECFVLKESVTLFFFALTLWTCAEAARGRPWGLAGQGFAAAALVLSRPAGALWALVSTLLSSFPAWRKGAGAKRTALPLLALAGGVVALGAFNAIRSGSSGIMDTNVVYNLQVGSMPDAKSFNVDTSSLDGAGLFENAARAAWNAPAKFRSLLGAEQPPDNINYYFMKSALPLLAWTPGPLLLIPFGAGGLLLCAFAAVRRRRASLAIAPLEFLCVAAPICAFVVTGRYMLFLLPPLAFGAGFVAHAFLESCRKARAKKSLLEPAAIALLCMLLVLQAIPKSAALRSDDFLGYGLAAEMKYGRCPLEGQAYLEALKLNPESYKAAINLSKWLLDEGRFDDAAKLLEGFRAARPEDFSLLVNHSLALLQLGRGAEAERGLLAFGEPREEARAAKWRKLLEMARGVRENAPRTDRR